MNTTAALAASCAFVAVAIAMPASAEPGITVNGPALDGQKVALPGTSEIRLFGGGCPLWQCGANGSALDGHEVVLPDGPIQARR